MVFEHQNANVLDRLVYFSSQAVYDVTAQDVMSLYSVHSLYGLTSRLVYYPHPHRQPGCAQGLENHAYRHPLPYLSFEW